jgi:outer membrane protein assembly factor BamB
MAKYDLGGAAGFEDVGVVQTVDLSQFSDLNLVNVISLAKESKRDSPWGVKTGGSVACRSITHKGVLYFGANDHNFYAIDMKTGEELWRFGTGGPVGVWGSASIWEDRIVFPSYDGKMYCLSLDGKRLLWKFAAKDKIATIPVIHDDVMYFGSKDCNFYAVSVKTGEEKWRLSIDYDICCPAIIYRGNVYFGSRDGVYKASLDGKLLWKLPLDGDVDASIAAHEDTIYFGCSNKNIYAVSTDGNLVWRFPTGGPVINNCIFHRGRIYIGCFDDNLYCLNIDGSLAWKFRTGDIITAPPQIYEDRVYFVSFDKCLYCVDLNGRLVWKKPLGLLLYLYVQDGVIYASDWDCKMRAFTTDGKVLWDFNTSMGRPSEIEFEPLDQVSVEIVHRPILREGKEKAGEEGIRLVNYGDFTGRYVGEEMRDYLGSPTDKDGLSMTYKRVKRVYRK